MKLSEDGIYFLSCPTCGSKDLIKKGTQKSAGGNYRQRYLCNSCKTKTIYPIKNDLEVVRENVKLAKQKQSAQDVNRIERKAFREHARYENAVHNLLFDIQALLQNKIFLNLNLKKSNKARVLEFCKYLIHILTNLFPYLITIMISKLLVDD